MSKKRKPIFIGEKFGRLTVIKDLGIAYKTHKNYLCSCECGKEKIILSGSLTAGLTNSCGCINIEKLSSRRKPAGEITFNGLFKDLKNRAKKAGLSLNLEKQDFLSIIQNNCFYCNAIPVARNKYTNKYRNLKANPETIKRATVYVHGIDRVDNNLGYVKNNCVSCCKQCNTAKLDHSVEDFKNWLINCYNFFVIGKKNEIA